MLPIGRKKHCKGRWYNLAWDIIEKIDQELPPDASLKHRIHELRGCPFPGSWPVKAWYRARKEYLAQYASNQVGKIDLTLMPTPLEEYIDRMMNNNQEKF